MIAVPESLPDDPILLKHLLLLASEQAAAKDARIEQLQEQVALLRHKLFSPKSERSPEDADSPQLAMFNEVEELIEAPAAEPAEAEAEEVVAPVKRRGKRKPLPANLPRMEVIHELPEHELTCACGACKQSICSIGTLSLPSRAHPNRPSVSVAVGQFGWARVQILAGELNTGCALRSGS